MNIRLTAYNKNKSICYPIGTRLICKKEVVDGKKTLRLYDNSEHVADVVRDIFDENLVYGSIPALCVLDNLTNEFPVLVTEIGQVNDGNLKLALVVDVEIKRSYWKHISYAA
jgi:hypothetical protein